MKKEAKRNQNILIFVSLILVLVSFGCVEAFDFYGYTKYKNSSVIGGVNVSLYIYEIGPEGMKLNTTYSILSNTTTGFFNISVPSSYENNNFFFQPKAIKYNSSSNNYALYISQSSPQLPYQAFAGVNNVTFYLREAATLYFSGRGDQKVLLDPVYGSNYTLGGDYKVGLEIINDSMINEKRYAYVNDSDCLIVLNSSRAINFTECNLNIINIKDFTYSPSFYFFVNDTNLSRCYINDSSTLICNLTANLSYNFSQVEGIEYYKEGSNDYLLVLGKNNSAATILTKYYLNLTLTNVQTLQTGAGKMDHYTSPSDFKLFIFHNNSGIYQITECYPEGGNFSCAYERSVNITPVIDGIDFDPFDGKWYYSSDQSNNMTEIEFLRNQYPFRYQIKDTSLGYPVEENFDSSVYGSRVFLPADRNYSIMIYPERVPSFPIKIELNNVSSYNIGGIHYINLTDINLTTNLVRVSGYVIYNSSLSEQNYTEFKILTYLLETGNRVFKGASLPPDMGVWEGTPDVFNKTTGFYNMTLPAASFGSDLLMLALVTINNSGTLEYWGGLRNLTLTSGTSIGEFNFTVFPLLGSLRPLKCGLESTCEVNTSQTLFQFINESGDRVLENKSSFVEVEVDYSDMFNVNSFSWIIDSKDGNFTLPLFNHSIKKIMVFSQDFSPRKVSLRPDEIQSDSINITLRKFRPGDPDNLTSQDFLNNIRIMIYKSGDNCSVPNPSQSCYLIPKELNHTEFNPLSVILGGGKLNFEIKLIKTNVSVRYIDVDLLASGPPDALFDEVPNQTSLGEIWRFGSSGPEIYKWILIGIPYNESIVYENKTAIINITHFFSNENLNESLWIQGVNSTSDLTGTEYEDYNSGEYRGYINGSAVRCSDSDENLTSHLCYRDNLTNIIWFKIPHFSGIGPKVSSLAVSSGESGNEESSGDSGSASSEGGASSNETTEFWVGSVYLGSLKEEERNLNLFYRRRVFFKINNSLEYIGLVSVTNNKSARLNFSFSPELTFDPGDEMEFDVNKDGYFDMYIKIEKIGSNYITLTLKKIYKKKEESEVTGETQSEKTPTNETTQETKGKAEEEKEKESKKSNTWIWIVIGVSVVIVIGGGIIIYFALSKKRVADKKG